MLNKQVFDYIRQQKQQGVSEEEIKSSLVKNGWQVQDINEAFSSIQDTPIPQFTYAGFWIRFEAFFIDSLISVIPYLLIKTFVTKSISLPSQNFFLETPFLITVPLIWFYFILTTYKYGATLGKMAFKLKVVAEGGQKPSFSKIIIRETMGRTLSSLFGIGYAMIARSNKKQAWHDRLAGTYVMQTKPELRPSKIVISLVTSIYALSILLPVIGIIGLGILLSHPSTREVLREISPKTLKDINKIQLALNAYSIDHNNIYPQSLNQLIPEYVKDVVSYEYRALENGKDYQLCAWLQGNREQVWKCFTSQGEVQIKKIN